MPECAVCKRQVKRLYTVEYRSIDDGQVIEEQVCKQCHVGLSTEVNLFETA